MAAQKLLAIGDVHGCLQSMNKLLEQLEGYRDYIHVFVGDYIDRGPESSGVIDRLIQLQEERECIFLRGNHEQMLLDACFNGQLDLWLMNGGESTLKSYGATYDNLNIPDKHIRFYQKTKMYFETENYFLFMPACLPERPSKKAWKTKNYRKNFYGNGPI